MPKFDFINKKDEMNKQEKWKLSQKRSLLKSKSDKKKSAISAIVSSIVGKNYLVEIENKDGFVEIECIRAGTITTHNVDTQIIAVGDKVKILYDEPDINCEIGTIIEVEHRDSWLSRTSIIGEKEDVVAANCQRMVIMMAAADPFYNRRVIDRFLIAAVAGGIEPAICINKTELMPIDLLEKDMAPYKKMGIEVFFISAHLNKNIKQISEYIKNHTTAFSGPSGVGKSTLLNLLYGDDIQKISEISERTGKGRHTTSTAKFIRFDEDTCIIDTPGVREFGLWNIQKEELPTYFSDFAPYYDNCKFTPCSHTHEPNCAVKSAVENSEIDSERYQSYLNIFESLKD